MSAPSARDWWLRLEPVHAVVYFDEGCRASMADLGLRGFWMGYVAGRAAPLGPVGPDPVAAVFFNFAPPMIARALRGAWAIAPPARVWAARRAGAADTLRRIAPDVDDRAQRARRLLEGPVAAAAGAGRPLFAATRATGWPDDPVEALWHACTCLREHRGDGHVAALVASGLDPVEVLVLFAASAGLAGEMFRAARGWSEQEWADAAGRLCDRGLLDEAGVTPGGTRLRRSVEETTDRLAAPPFAVLDARERRELTDLLDGLGTAILASGVISYPNPMGLPRPVGG